jgi:hypothetical protein
MHTGGYNGGPQSVAITKTRGLKGFQNATTQGKGHKRLRYGEFLPEWVKLEGAGWRAALPRMGMLGAHRDR